MTSISRSQVSPVSGVDLVSVPGLRAWINEAIRDAVLPYVYPVSISGLVS